jgi:pimeloyl-ACP methyl ester carboxylesterase
MAEYQETHYDVNGIDTAVFTAGEGVPLVYLHGAGTAPGFDSLLPMAEHLRLILPHHPGFGASADDPNISEIHDYVRHYLDLFDQMGLDEFSVIGHSLGGYISSTMAMYVGSRISSMVLIAPFGLRSKEHPTTDLFMLPDEEVFGCLTVDPAGVMAGKMTLPPSPEFLADRYREATSGARIFWERPYDLKLARWLHRVTQPTLLVWGEDDGVVPIGQAAEWAALLPHATLKTFPGQGHLLCDECPDEVAEAIAGFVLATVATPAG